MNNKLKRIIFPVTVLLAASGLASLIVATKNPPEKKEEISKAPFVSTEVIQLQPMTLSVKSQGLVTAKYNTQLLAQVSGEITQISDKFVKGGVLKRGDLLAEIDPFNYQVNLQQATASLASAKAQFILERAQGQVAEAEWQQITNAKPSELGLRKPQQEQALAAVKAAEAGVKQAEKDLQRTRIVAPFTALVTNRQISPGSFVNLGTAIGEVMDVETAEVRLPVPASELAYLVNRGVGAQVTLNAVVSGKTQQWQARIVRDEGVVDDASRMIYLVAEIIDPYALLQTPTQNPNYKTATPPLPFGTYVTAEIQGAELQEVALVPRHLLKEGKVAVVENNSLRFSEVTVYRHQGTHSIVVDGLNDGDRLITSTLAYPVDGMAVATKSSQSANDTAVTQEESAQTPAKKES